MANDDDATPAAGKGRATPKRKEQEALKRRPLVMDTKADAQRRRQQMREQRLKQHEAMLTGNERAMPPQHAGRARRFARDFIDSRTTVAEFMLPASMVGLFVLFFFGQSVEAVSITGLVLMLMFLAWIVEAWILIRRLKKAALAKFGQKEIPRMYGFYAFSRLLQVRRLRMPKPQVKRGEYPL